MPGGLVDGPVYGKVYDSLLGLHLTDEDEFAEFQTKHVVYHDDIGDYSTNEPTMDGTAGAILMMAHFGVSPQAGARRSSQPCAATASGFSARCRQSSPGVAQREETGRVVYRRRAG